MPHEFSAIDPEDEEDILEDQLQCQTCGDWFPPELLDEEGYCDECNTLGSDYQQHRTY